MDVGGLVDRVRGGWLVFATLGEMGVGDVVGECGGGGWSPVLVFRDGDVTVVPVLASRDLCVRFAKRNLPRGQVFGMLVLTDEDVVRLVEGFVGRGFVFEFLDHPRRLRGRADVEVYEFAGSPDVFGVRG